jgi:hypothetical protein
MPWRKRVFGGLCLLVLGVSAAQAERAREIVTLDDVRIDVIAEGSGPPFPSSSLISFIGSENCQSPDAIARKSAADKARCAFR